MGPKRFIIGTNLMSLRRAKIGRNCHITKKRYATILDYISRPQKHKTIHTT